MKASHLRVVLLALFAAIVFSASLPAAAFGAQKTVHVKQYKKKDGGTVKAHDRKVTKAKGSIAKTAKAKKASSPSTRTPAVTHASRCSDCDRDEKGRIVRGREAKTAFMRATGFPHGRPGFVIDHIVPLACHGADRPSNMQWQTKEAAKAKDKTERAGCR